MLKVTCSNTISVHPLDFFCVVYNLYPNSKFWRTNSFVAFIAKLKRNTGSSFKILCIYSRSELNFLDLINLRVKIYFNPDNLTSYPGTGTAVNDLSGNSLNGTMSNVTFNYPSFTYNGTNSQVSISDNALLEPGSGDWTIEVWVNQTVSTGSQVILGKFDTGGGAQDVSYAVRVLNGSVRADFGNGSTAINTSSYALNSGSWYQLTYVFNNVANNNIITYVNGVEQSTTTHSFSSILNTTANLYLGSYNNGEYSQYFNGKIGITRIYESALGSSDVLTNFNANRERYGL